MNYGPVIFLGLLFTVWFSWYGFILKNYKDFGRERPAKLDTGGNYPVGRPGLARAGQEIYQQNGCASCHTMQVRMKGYGADIERGFGRRNTVLTDFLYDDYVFLGQTRLGPDLSNTGLSKPNLNWHLVHLYNPRILVPESLMPRYEFLFEKRRIQGRPSPNALILPTNVSAETVEEGYEIIPTDEAIALAAYMVSLRAETPLFHAPIIPPPTNDTAEASAPGGTNEQQNAQPADQQQNTNSPAPAE